MARILQKNKKSEKCPICGSPMKSSHSECYGCSTTRKVVGRNLAEKGGKDVDVSVKHVAKFPRVMAKLFGIQTNTIDE